MTTAYRILATHPRIASAYIRIRAAGYSSGGASLSNRAERVLGIEHASTWRTRAGAERVAERLRLACNGPFTEHWAEWSFAVETPTDPLIRSLYAAAAMPEESPEDAAARQEARDSLHARIDADIAETEARRHLPRLSHGVIHFPQAMLDAFGLTEMDR